MSHRIFASLSVALAVCLIQPVAQITALPEEAGSRIGPAAQGVPGTYELTFMTPQGQPILNSTLFVNEELVLWAHVEDSSGLPANGGLVTFQVCGNLRPGGPRPSGECDISGTARWTSLTTMKVTEGTCPWARGPGNACVDFGAVANPRTIGFRFRFTGQGSGIASGYSESKDATWIPR